ncbi:hypothetical protein AWN76_005130 [Rhodothermaceae bacterium RA]|nr:hypothetical protein AWN76_005130 [Rhodothermaceae bacterium RA]
MVPVELRLTNFLSYGTAAPPLDFEQFHVACLSGRNGQGKSALLDAITWALWGEGRKSSDNRKPDADLIRIGAQRMQVEFVFDLEGERYRVVRAYTESASGKTSRPELEFHLYEAATGQYRPITAGSLRETQAQIDRVLGIDYETFINSSFLLQGRSDEFTKKRPSERKQILARILNLGKYDRLAERARQREREAAERVQRAEAEIERLKAALEPEAAWQAEQEAVLRDIEEAGRRLEAARQVETHVAEQIATLEARAREAEALRAALARIDEERTACRAETEDLRQRIQAAETLLARREQIQRDYDRYEALTRERDDLHTKGELFRGIERQLAQKESQLKDLRTDLEKQVDRLEHRIRTDQDQLNEHRTRLGQFDGVRAQLEKARQAGERLETLEAVRNRRGELEEQRLAVRNQVLEIREQMKGRLQSLEAQIERDAAERPDVEALEAEQARLEAAAARREALQQQLEQTTQAGQHVREAMEKLRGQIESRREEQRRLQDDLDRVRRVEASVCPTCGSELTERHRAEVEARLRGQIDAIEEAIAGLDEALQRRAAERERLREAYRTLDEQRAALDAVPEQLAGVRHRLEQARRTGADLQQRRAEAAELRRRIEEKDYAPDERRRYQALCKELEALDFDEEAYQQTREVAAQRPHLERLLRELEEVAGRREQLEQAIARQQKELEELRRQLGDGSAFGALPAQIETLRKQLTGIGFDARRFEEVRQQLNALSEAGARLKDLLNAQQNQAAWQKQLERIAERLNQLNQDQTDQAEALACLEAELEGRADLATRRQEAAATREAAEHALQDLQRRLGELQARLQQAENDRAALEDARREHRAARKERTLYRHLKTAFGKHGIPSLIIEQTLPEIEERANDLLERLTDGKMRVRLETLKDKKSGGTKETLNIIITDEQGIPRPYETFSGGEAFRANFALRIALSQLLADRADVRIRTLVIDEGFGTQDTQGLQNLVEAIQVIKDDFAKILVITHLEELKEAFPVRIEVEKHPTEGSRFEVIGV